MIDSTSILDLHRDPLFAHGENEIDFGFGFPFGKMCDVQTDHRAEKVTDDPLGDVSREIVEVRRCGKTLGIERDYFLQPGGSKHRVAEAELRDAATSFETQFEGLDQPDQQGVVEELEVSQCAASRYWRASPA